MTDPASEPLPPVSVGSHATLGQLLRKHRKARGLTLDELASRVGRAKSYLSQLENDRRRPPRDLILVELERALGLAAGTLLSAVRWTQTPPTVRREVSQLHSERERKDRMLRQLRELMTSGEAGAEGASKSSLDTAFRSGQLRALIDRLVPPGPESGHAMGGKEREGRVEGDGSAGWPRSGSRSDQALDRTSDRTSDRGLDRGVSLGAAVGLSLSLEVPLVNSVAAGYPRDFTDLGYPARIADEYVRCPDLTDPDAFAARVVGDSMSPTYTEGDIVIFSPAKVVKDGCDCFVRLEPDHETTFKRVYSETDQAGQAVIRLQPLNSAFAPRTLPREQVAAMFAAVNVIKKIV